ncbi:MAG: hypothetical protein MJ132_02665 [Clostridia bacterium]|nr:hypothetical protein [Clostridia bacterium]
MKKLFSVILAFVLVLSFAACTKNKSADAPQEVTQTVFVDKAALEQNVTDGKIPEMEHALGQDVEAMKSALEQQPQENQDDEDYAGPYTLLEKADYTVISTGIFRQFEYCCRADGKVSAIATSDTAFGLENSTFINEIELALADCSAQKLSGAKVPWLPSGEMCDCLTATFGENAVSFLFVDNQLVKTVVYRAEEWTIQ